MIHRLIKTWRRQIPAMTCIQGCRECCEGYAPAMTKWEWQQLLFPVKYKPGQILEECPFLGESGCTVYARRPLICRIFGTVSRAELEESDLAAVLPVCCPKGCEPAQPFPLKEALRLQVEYQKCFNQELRAVAHTFRQYTVLRHPGEDLPAKFEWLFYMLCTRDGQNNLAQIAGRGRPALSPEELGRLAAVIGG